MSKVIELVNLSPSFTWSAWDALALTLLNSAAAAVLVAVGFIMAGKDRRAMKPFLLIGVAAAAAGFAALGISLGQPFRGYQFLTSPQLGSWTAWGAFIVPLFMVVAGLAAFSEYRKDGMKPPLAGLAVLLSLAVFVYASQEIADLAARPMWDWSLLPLAFLFAGLSGGIGLAAVLHGLKGSHGGKAMTVIMTVAALVCAVFTQALAVPSGYVLEAGTQWNYLSIIGPLAAAVSLAGLRFSNKGLTVTSGLACFAAGLAFFAKLVFLGQAIPRNSYTSLDELALARMFSWESWLALAGSLAILLVLTVILSGAFAEKEKATRG